MKRVAFSAVLVMLASNAAHAHTYIDEPSPKAAGAYVESEDALQFIVALMPPFTEGAVEPPLDTTAQSKYCAAVDDWARRTYRLTEGRHRIFRVHFYHADIALPNEAGIQILWFRQNGSPHVGVTQGQPHDFIEMFDNVKGCAIDWQVTDGVLENAGQYCDLEGGVCVDDGGPLGRLFCTVDDVPVQRPASDWGWVLTHEAGHWFYGLNDEYFNALSDPYPNFKVCVGDPGTNQGTPETSMMAEWHRGHWCDDVTHLQSLVYQGVEVDNPTATSMWTTVTDHWPELAGHVHGTYAEVDADALPPVDCVFHPAAPNDSLLVLDRSGSMDYADPVTGQTALEQAVEAALGLYNTTLVGESSGILGFNEQVTTLVDYAPYGGTPESEIDVDPMGFTDLCSAITTAAQMVRAEHPDEAHGSALLLSDGLPTVAGCSTGADVLDAAWEACFGGDYPVAVSTLAFGDADAELLFDVATLCHGKIFAMGQETSEILPPPHELKIDLSVAASAVRDRTRLLLKRRTFVPLQQTEVFFAPAAARSLEMVWLGDGHPACNLDLLEFELVSPSGTVHAADAASPVGPDEIAYHTRTVRIANPEPGPWAARVSAGGPSFPCNGTRFGWLAHLDHRDLRAEAAANPPVAPRNWPVRLTTSLHFPSPHRGTPLTVAASVLHRGTATPVVMRDDGTWGDEIAADGIYTAVFNPDGLLYPAGIYTLRVQLTSSQGGTEPVAEPPGCVETGETAAPPARGTAQVEVDAAFVYRPCCDPDIVPPTPSAQCEAAEACTDAVLPHFGSLTAGSTYQDLTLTLAGHEVGSTGVRLGLGPGITVTDVTSTPSPSTGTTLVRFDAAVGLNAPDGLRDVRLRWGGKRLGTAAAFGVTSTAAGTVPGGMKLARQPDGGLLLSWSRSCSRTDQDYAVYEGRLGDFASHLPRTCTTAGATSASLPATEGDRYYLVVPLSSNREGSYGRDGGEQERPASLSSCRPQKLGACGPAMTALAMP